MSSSGAIRAGRAFVELFADNTRLQQGLRLAETQLKEFGAKVSTMGKQIATVSLVPLIPAGIGTKIFAGFDDQMRAVQAVTGSTGEAFEQLTEKAKFLGRTTSFTAKEVASGMLELGRAGFKSDEIDAAISHVMDLARSTQTEIPRATEIAGNALRGFGLDASEMGRVSDVLATTANNSAQTLDDLGEAFKYVAPVASTAGMSLEDTAKVLGTLANFGIKGSLAGTAVKNILTRMADPDIQAKYESLGVKVKDAEGNLRNMADVLKEVGVATANMPNAEKLAVFKELFDMRALAGGAKLTSESFESLCNAIDNASGESARVAKTMDEGIGGSFRMFLSAAEGIAIAIGETLAPEIKRMSDYLTESQTKITDWINEHKQAIVSITQFAAKALVLGGSIYLIGKAASAVGITIGMFRSSLVAVRAVVSILTTDLSKIGSAFANLGNLFKPIEPVNASVDAKSAASVQTLGTSAASATTAVTQLNVVLNAMRTAATACAQAVTALVTPVSQLLNAIRPLNVFFTQGAKSVGMFAKALTPLSQSLSVTATASTRLSTAGTALGRSFAGMDKRITVTSNALRENNTASKMAASGIRSTRLATVSATKGFTAYTKALNANTAAITKNVQAGGVAPNMYFKNAAAVETESAALAKNGAARTANASVVAETTAAREVESVSIATNTTALDSSTISIAAESAATGTSTEVLTAHSAAQTEAATASTVLTGSTDASTAATLTETAATTASTEAAAVNATAQGEEAASLALSTAASDANTVSVAGNTVATDSNAVSLAVDNQALAGNTISLEGNAAALTSNTTATLANDAAVKTLSADTVVATGIFSKLGTAISTTFATKTGGFLALSNKEAFTATAKAMSSAWTSASNTVTSAFASISGAFTNTTTSLKTLSLATVMTSIKTTALSAVQKTCSAVMVVSSGVYKGIAAVLGVFSLANIKAASTTIGVTTAAVGAKVAVAAYGVAATVCSGATKALSAAMALICAHPVAAALTALAAIVAGLCIYLKDAGKYTAQLSDEMTKLSEAGNKTRTLDDNKMEGIQKLGAKSQTGSLDDKEFAQGKSWVEELTGRYGDLGIQIDEVNKKIIVATDSQKKFLEAMNQDALQQKDSVIAEEEKNLKELEKEYQAKVDRMEGWAGWAAMEARGVGQVFTAGYVDSAEEAWPKQLEEQNKKIEEQKKKLAELRKERKMLEGGDETIAKGGSIEESVQKKVADIKTPEGYSGPFDVNEFEEKLRNSGSTGSGGSGTTQPSDIASLQTGYNQAVTAIQSQIANAMSQEEKDAGQARLASLDKLFTTQMAQLTAALPENKAQSDFWDKIKESGMSAEEKEIAQLNKDLTAVLEAIKTEVGNAANNTPKGEIPQITVSTNELETAYQPELETVSAQSDDAKSLVDKATSGEYTDPEEFTKDSAAVIDNLDKTLEGMNPGPEREKLATAIEALKTFCEQFVKTIGKEDKKAKVDAQVGSNIKQKAAQNATDSQIKGVRDKYAKERQQKMKDTEIENLPLTQAAQNRDQKKMALDTAKAGGDKKQIAKAQLEYDQASNDYEQKEKDQHQQDLDTSAQEMQTALGDYTNAGDDPEKREEAKKRYDEAKSKHDSAQSYFDEKGSAQKQQVSLDTRKAKTNRDEKRIALDEAKKSGNKTKIAKAQKEYNTAQSQYENAQYKQNLNTSAQTADANVETTSATLAEKDYNLRQAQMSGNPEQIEQAQSEYNEADYAKKQAEYQKALSDAQNSAYEVSDAEKNLKQVMKNGTPEEKAAAKERLKEAKSKQKDAMKTLAQFDTGKAVRQASPDYSNPQSSESGDKGEKDKTEVKDTASGTFDAFEALGQNYDWQKTNGEKQLHTLTDIRSLLEQQNGDYI